MNLRYTVICALLVAAIARPTHAQWTKRANIPNSGIDAGFAFGVGDKVYFGGGYGITKAFYEYDPVANKWTRKADIPVAKLYRCFGVSFSIGSKGYVALGQSDTTGGGQPTVTNDIWEYDPSANVWTRKADFPGSPRDGAMAFVVNGKAYVGAGVSASAQYVGDMYEYDPVQDKWTKKADMPNGPLGFPMAFSIGSKGYMVCGGRGGELTEGWAYDPSLDQWDPIADFPGTAREAGVGFDIDTLGYVGLGEANYTTTYSDIYSYNPKTDTWSKVTPSFPYELGVGWPTVAVSGETAYMGSGADQNFAYKNLWYGYSTQPLLTAATLTAPANNASINDTAIDFSWQAVPTATGYHLEISLNSSFSGQLFEQQVTTPTAHVQTLLPGTFYWRVAAKRPDGEGPWSEVRSFSEGLGAGVASSGAKTSFTVYPNPTRDVLNLSSAGSVVVYDLLGREVLSAHSATGTLDVSSLPNGEYRCVLTTPNSMVSTTRFVKQ